MLRNFALIQIVLAIFLICNCNAHTISKRNSDESATNGQFPFYVQLESHSAAKKGLAVKTCGGTLISDKWILTSAHCVSHAFRVLAYFDPFSKTNSTKQIQTISRNHFVIYPQYSAEHFLNDIALLKLPNAAQISDTVKPKEISQCIESNGDENIVAIGGTNALKWSMLKTISIKDCKQIFPVFQFSHTILCANYYENHCACKVNNGGPVLDQSRNTILGIINYAHHNICELRVPRTFTLVTPYYQWISEHTGLKLPVC